MHQQPINLDSIVEHLAIRARLADRAAHDGRSWMGLTDQERAVWRQRAAWQVEYVAEMLIPLVREQAAERLGEHVLSGGLPVCTQHPGRENHCRSGYCAGCWLCQENGITDVHEVAYSQGMREGTRRAAYTLRQMKGLSGDTKF